MEKRKGIKRYLKEKGYERVQVKHPSSFDRYTIIVDTSKSWSQFKADISIMLDEFKLPIQTLRLYFRDMNGNYLTGGK